MAKITLVLFHFKLYYRIAYKRVNRFYLRFTFNEGKGLEGYMTCPHVMSVQDEKPESNLGVDIFDTTRKK